MHDVLDDFDLRILRALQANGDISMAELGERVGLSHTPCWRRVKKLEASGFIRDRVVLL
ncbi:MAG: winged helix-turn-helix transcriptional regulator, partial [Pseudomonadales bacterium]|nr:winged helix-turn-helix transcriptional regulator [Pseudomonadales bacterium]